MITVDPANPRLRAVAPAREQAVNIIRTIIASGAFPPGRRLLERELLAATGMSRTTVREALRQLEAEGLIEMLPGRGPIVAPITPEITTRVYEVRQALEGLAAQLFVQRATDEDMRALEAAYQSIELACSGDDVARILAAKDQFYDAIFAGAKNDYLEAIMRSLHGRVQLIRSLSLSAPGRESQSLSEIKALVDALRQRDKRAAVRASNRHIDNATESAMTQLYAYLADTESSNPNDERQEA